MLNKDTQGMTGEKLINRFYMAGNHNEDYADYEVMAKEWLDTYFRLAVEAVYELGGKQ